MWLGKTCFRCLMPIDVLGQRFIKLQYSSLYEERYTQCNDTVWVGSRAYEVLLGIPQLPQIIVLYICGDIWKFHTQMASRAGAVDRYQSWSLAWGASRSSFPDSCFLFLISHFSFHVSHFLFLASCFSSLISFVGGKVFEVFAPFLMINVDWALALTPYGLNANIKWLIFFISYHTRCNSHE